MKTPLLIIGTLFAFILTAQAEDIPEAVESQCKVLLEATQENDLEKFESVCDDAMKEAMTPEKIKSVSDQMSKLMKQGYTTTFLGSVDRLSHKTYYWKLTYKIEGVSEVLVQLSTSGNKVSGFFLQ